jgi:hypothetical protein
LFVWLSARPCRVGCRSRGRLTRKQKTGSEAAGSLKTQPVLVPRGARIGLWYLRERVLGKRKEEVLGSCRELGSNSAKCGRSSGAFGIGLACYDPFPSEMRVENNGHASLTVNLTSNKGGFNPSSSAAYVVLPAGWGLTLPISAWPNQIQ